MKNGKWVDFMKYVSAKYIREKSSNIQRLLDIVNDEELDRDDVSEIIKERIGYDELAFAFGVLAKEIGLKIPTNL